jgi:hypothetical protein
MNGKKAKMIRKLTREHALDSWPAVDYKTVNERTKTYKNLMGKLSQYHTHTLVLVVCKRKFMKELKKDVKKGVDILSLQTV